MLAKVLYNNDNPSTLTQEQKDTLSTIIRIGTTTAAVATTGEVSGAVNAGEVGRVGVENNGTGKVVKTLTKVSDEAYEIALDSVIPRNLALAGKLHPKTNVPFDSRGYPDFSNHLYMQNGKNVDVNIGALTGSRRHDDKLANAIAGFDDTPKGYTWHHHQDLGRMQLVKNDIHSRTGHTGGNSIYAKAVAISAGLIASIKQADAGDYADFVFDVLVIPTILSPTSMADGTLDGSARREGFRDYQSYLEFQKRLDELKKHSKF